MATDTNQYGLMSETDSAFGVKVSGNERLRRNWKSLDTHYSPWRAAYLDVQEFIAPGSGRFPEKEPQANQRAKISKNLINPAAADALNVLGAGLQGGLSSPARPWFQLTFEDDGLNKYGPAKNWLDECEKKLYAILKKSDFYSVIHNVYEEVGGFGTGCIMVKADPVNVVAFDYFTAGDYRFAVAEDKRTHCLYRKIRMQLHQMAMDFGIENLSDTSRRLIDRNPYDWRDVLHVIEPNGQFDSEALDASGRGFGRNKPFVSTWIEWSEQVHILRQDGFYEMPIATPRWKARSGEAYGFGPGLLATNLAKSLQRMEKIAMLAEEKYIDPPMGIAAQFKDRLTDFSPGAKVHIRDTDDIRKAIGKLVDIDPQAISMFEDKIAKYEDRIRRLFYYELFLMIAQENRTMTATEVVARNEEKMILIGPVVTGQNYELLDPILHRTFAIAGRAGVLPPPPREIAKAQYKVEYVSVLAQAQKLVNAQGMNAYLATAERVAAFAPEAMDRTDWDQYLEEYADMVNISGKIIRDDDAVTQIREQRQKAAQEQQAMAQQDLNATTVQKMGSAKVGEGTMLDEFSRSMGAA